MKKDVALQANIYVYGNLKLDSLYDATDATSYSKGAVEVAGGLSLGGNV